MLTKTKKRVDILVSSGALDGQVIGIATGSRRFRLFDQPGLSSELAQEILEELADTAREMGGDALANVQFNMVGGGTRGDAARSSIGHILGWGTVVNRGGGSQPVAGRVQDNASFSPSSDDEEEGFSPPVEEPPQPIRIAPVPPPAAPKMWKVRTREGQVYKPAPEEKLIALLKAGKLKDDIEVCEQDGTLWRPVGEVTSFRKAFS